MHLYAQESPSSHKLYWNQAPASHMSLDFTLHVKPSKYIFLAYLVGRILAIVQSTWRKFVVYGEGTLYPSISLLEIGRDIMPTCRCKNPPTIVE
jgi:hypothetical protein